MGPPSCHAPAPLPTLLLCHTLIYPSAVCFHHSASEMITSRKGEARAALLTPNIPNQPATLYKHRRLVRKAKLAVCTFWLQLPPGRHTQNLQTKVFSIERILLLFHCALNQPIAPPNTHIHCLK